MNKMDTKIVNLLTAQAAAINTICNGIRNHDEDLAATIAETMRQYPNKEANRETSDLLDQMIVVLQPNSAEVH